MSPPTRAIGKAFGGPPAFRQWVGLLPRYALVDTVSGQCHDFGTLGAAGQHLGAARQLAG